MLTKLIRIVPITFGKVMILSLFLKASVDALALNLIITEFTAEFNNNLRQSLVQAVGEQKRELRG